MMSDGEMLPAIALELRPFTPRAHFQGAISLVIDPNGEAELVDYSPYGLRVERRLLGRIPAEKVRLWQRRLESPGMWKMTTPPPHLVMEGDIFELRASASNSTPRGLGGNLSLASEGLKELVDELLQASLALKAAPACVGYLRITVHPGVPPPRRVRLEDLSPRIREMVQSTHRRGRTFSPLDAEAAAAVSKVGQQLFVEHEKRVFELMQFSSREAAPNPNQ